MMKQVLIVIGVIALFTSFKAPASKHPFGYIPLYQAQDSNVEAILLNVQQISRIVPNYTEGGSSVTVYFQDGEEFYIDEPYDEFKDRVRNSMK